MLKASRANERRRRSNAWCGFGITCTDLDFGAERATLVQIFGSDTKNTSWTNLKMDLRHVIYPAADF